MANLKDLKNRISSVKNTRKITKAMQMVAAAKLRRAQEAAENARPYAEQFNGVMGQLASSVGDSPTAPLLLRGTGQEQTYLLVVMTAEKGLCGGFNTNIAKKASARIRQLVSEGKTVKIITVGKKGRAVLRRTYGDMLIDHVDMTDVKRVGYGDAQGIAKNVLDRFDGGEFDVAYIYYGEFENVMTQIPTEQQIIPATFDRPEGDSAAGNTLFDYEPSEEAILADLLPRGVATQIFAALLENGASEQGARMSAMDSATRNADDMVENLNREYNRTRQAVITNELIEIISGAEAL
ncbi:F-type H+-transporting ATPase subunit gamma [Palleronia marisminoris]|uniref:ATP synthase gamma chain n=1 Tax=Palleronia marisminoris TaxID=315423 RepID=A0A1Y5RWW2_9RHOB|nr:F0F1 ATP synthase subunit gamma [Palleronia marisminoris]SFG43590.1 F-type H+-transporting ATPase subunit gamma [Palleronia marisminoris]SLN27076.1 ATP synthase gamma chain [Palleronia marisminoris]